MSISFSSIVKNEVSKIEEGKLENIAILSAIVRNSGEINEKIEVITENASIARKIFKLFKEIYNINPGVIVRKRYNFNKGLNYIIDVKEKKDEILEDLSIYNNGEYLNIPRNYIIAEDTTKRAYLTGLFISVGSINDPKTSRYHLEFLVDDSKYAIFIRDLLNQENLNSRIIKRKNNYMVYIKEAEKISDFLRTIKAYNAVMYYEDIRIYRDHKNMTNRLNNCEQANVDKIFFTSNSQLKDIEKIKMSDLYDYLDDKMKELITYREKYKESSLQELSEIISLETGNKISKSGLNHRFRKLKEIADNIK